MSDLISRQAVLDKAYAYGNGLEPDGFCVDVEDIQALPPAQQWIPCSEGLPEDEQLVIFSTKTGRVHQGKYHKDNSVNQWYSNIDKMRAWNNVINAWMPLPKPYKGADDD